jgi:lysophospholipase L1-like esterase
MGRARVKRAVFALYLLALHALVLLLLVKTDFSTRAGKTLGWLPPEEFSELYYRTVLAQAARAKTVPPGGWLLLGDSIVAGLDPSRIAPGAANFGLAGDTVRTLAARLPTLGTLDRAGAIVLGVGVNDLKYRQPAQIAADYTALLAALPRVPVLALLPLPVDEAGPAALARAYLRNALIAALDDAERTACTARPRCTPVAAPRVQYGPDGWHLSASGSEALADVLREHIK